MDWFSPFAGGLLGVLLFGCFVQVITILSLIRFGLGLRGVDMGIVSFLLALVLSLLMVEGKFGISGSLDKTIAGTPLEFSPALEPKVKPFLLAATDPEIARRLRFAQTSSGSSANEPSLAELEAGFILSQLKRALNVGLILLIPLIVIDVLVAVALAAVGIQTLSTAVVAIPLKILLFVMIDGWNLIVNKLLTGFL